jgi:hypothetical protein
LRPLRAIFPLNWSAMNANNYFSQRNKAGIILLLIVLAMVTTVPHVKSWNDASRMATVQSLVEHYTFKIDQSVFVNSGDKVFVNGHFYSDKPVVPSVLGAVVYWPLFHLGFTLDYGWNFAYWLITLLIVKGFWLMGLLAFYGSLSLTSLESGKRFCLTAALGVASLYFTWSSTFNNHILAASALMIGFYFFLQAKQADSVKRHLFFAGFFFSLAGAVDMPVSAFYVVFAGYALMQATLRRNVLFYMIPLAVTIFPALLHNYLISGSIMPLQLNQAYFDYPGSPWNGADSLSGMNINDGPFILRYGFSVLLGNRGFLLYNPFLFIALPCLIREISTKRMFMHEAMLIGSTSIVIVLYYLLFTNNHGGDSYSIRWFVPLLPLLFFFMHPFFENFTANRRRVFIAVFFVSTVIASIGLISAWSLAALSDTPILANIMELRLFLTR